MARTPVEQPIYRLNLRSRHRSPLATYTQIHTHLWVAEGLTQSQQVVNRRELNLSHPYPSVALRRRKTPGVAARGLIENGAGEETRTLDVHLGKVVLYQLSYARESGVRIRLPPRPAVNII